MRYIELEVVQKTKYLGVQIDCSLDWKEQIKAVPTKVSRAIGFFRHVRSFLPIASLKTLYTGIVRGVPTGGMWGSSIPPTFGKLVGTFYGWSVNVIDCR